MVRVPNLTRDMVEDPYKEAFDHETSESNGVVESGPGSVMIYRPEMRKRANHQVLNFRR